VNDPINIFLLIISYFIILLAVSYITGKDDSNKNFFTGNKNSKWYVVAFGMVGTSLSGVTFISVPGWIKESNFTYLQVVIGYLFGYFVVAFVLLPIYYKNNVTSIYEYLGKRFGQNSHKVGAFFFFVSRILGASFRLFLVAIVLQEFIFKKWLIPFEITVIFSIFLIWIYTNRGGIKTIIWTDTFQTALMIGAVFLSISAIANSLEINIFKFSEINEIKKYTKVFVFDSPLERNYFLKSFIGGFFITICMTGMDQDMMQKNLTCKNEKDAKKNMIVFSFILFIITFLFMFLGALLYAYAEKENINVPLMDGSSNTDLLFPKIALEGELGGGVAVTFIFSFSVKINGFVNKSTVLLALIVSLLNRLNIPSDTSDICISILSLDPESFDTIKDFTMAVVDAGTVNIVVLLLVVRSAFMFVYILATYKPGKSFLLLFLLI